MNPERVVDHNEVVDTVRARICSGVIEFQSRALALIAPLTARVLGFGVVRRGNQHHPVILELPTDPGLDQIGDVNLRPTLVVSDERAEHKRIVIVASRAPAHGSLVPALGHAMNVDWQPRVVLGRYPEPGFCFGDIGVDGDPAQVEPKECAKIVRWLILDGQLLVGAVILEGSGLFQPSICNGVSKTLCEPGRCSREIRTG